MGPARGRDFVVIGEVVKPHGVRGELCIECHADSPLLFGAGARLFLRQGRGRPRPCGVFACREHQGRLLVSLEGVEDRDGAEALRGCEILLPVKDLPETGLPGEYLHEIEGLNAVLPDGRVLGRVQGFLLHAGQEIWSILTPDGREVLLPAAPQFVGEIDTGAGTVRVDPPQGLLDIYLGNGT